MPGPVSDTLTLKWPSIAFAVTRTSPVSVNLMALPTRFNSTCVRRCSSPTPTGSGLATHGLGGDFFVLGKALGGGAHCSIDSLMGVVGDFWSELSQLFFGNLKN